MKRKLKILSLLLVLCLLLTGCGFMDYLERLAGAAGYVEDVAFEDMTYTRPDMDAHQKALEESCEIAMNAESIEEVVDAIYSYYDVYDAFYTNSDLAYIHYCQDVTDTYWSAEYDYCSANYAQVDAGLEELYYTLADCPWRQELESDEYFGEGYFDYYEGESIWDETLISMMEQEAELQSRYYELYEQSLEAEYYSEEYFTDYGAPMAQVFVELIALRQEMADWLGYESYPQLAYDLYFYRDYTPEQATDYLAAIGQEMGELYRQVNESDVWDLYDSYCSEVETFKYTRATAHAIGGDVLEAFQEMEALGLYDNAYSENKYNASFEVYLYSYYVPFVFTNPVMDPSDKLTFTHEFGHFCADFVSWGTYAGTDVSEVHSQALEYLSLLYGPASDDLVRMKMADCLMIYVEQAAYALFEHRVYDLKGEELTVENVQALYEDIGLQFGFDSWQWDSRDYVAIDHFFSAPMYVVSYVTSNDVALQLYQLEQAEKGEGLRIYEDCLYSQESYLVYFAESYGLESPFAPGRIEKVRQTLQAALG